MFENLTLLLFEGFSFVNVSLLCEGPCVIVSGTF